MAWEKRARVQSKYRNVYWNRANGNWTVIIAVGVGVFEKDEEEEAGRAAEEARRLLAGAISGLTARYSQRRRRVWR